MGREETVNAESLTNIVRNSSSRLRGLNVFLPLPRLRQDMSGIEENESAVTKLVGL